MPLGHLRNLVVDQETSLQIKAGLMKRSTLIIMTHTVFMATIRTDLMSLMSSLIAIPTKQANHLESHLKVHLKDHLKGHLRGHPRGHLRGHPRGHLRIHLLHPVTSIFITLRNLLTCRTLLLSHIKLSHFHICHLVMAEMLNGL